MDRLNVGDYIIDCLDEEYLDIAISKVISKEEFDKLGGKLHGAYTDPEKYGPNDLYYFQTVVYIFRGDYDLRHTFVRSKSYIHNDLKQGTVRPLEYIHNAINNHKNQAAISTEVKDWIG